MYIRQLLTSIAALVIAFPAAADDLVCAPDPFAHEKFKSAAEYDNLPVDKILCDFATKILKDDPNADVRVLLFKKAESKKIFNYTCRLFTPQDWKKAGVDADRVFREDGAEQAYILPPVVLKIEPEPEPIFTYFLYRTPISESCEGARMESRDGTITQAVVEFE